MSVRRTSEVPIPDDLRAFLAARKQLAYEPQLLSEVGVGTTFTVSLPVTPQPGGGDAPGSTPMRRRLASEKNSGIETVPAMVPTKRSAAS